MFLSTALRRPPIFLAARQGSDRGFPGHQFLCAKSAFARSRLYYQSALFGLYA